MPKDTDTNPFKQALAPPALKLQSDERLISLAREGHEQAFETIVERYQKPLTSYCRRLLGPDLAQDAVQQTFATAYAQLLEGSGPVHLRAWLYRVAGNLSISMLRRRYTDHQELSPAIGGSETAQPHTAVELDEEVRSMFKQLRRLPERERHALLLKATEGKSFDEIAAILGGTPEGAKQLAYRARRKLRDTLGAVLPVPLLLWLMRGGKSSSAGKGAVVASQGAKHGTLMKFAAAVLISAGAAYGINAAGHTETPGSANARAPQAQIPTTPTTTVHAPPTKLDRAAPSYIHPTSDPSVPPSYTPTSNPNGPAEPRPPAGDNEPHKLEKPKDEKPKKEKPKDDDKPEVATPTTNSGGDPGPGTTGPDPTAPDTTIDSFVVQGDSISFELSSTDSVTSFQCGYQGGAWSPCGSSQSYVLLPDGSYTLRARAVDAAGNVDPSPATRDFTISAGGPGGSNWDTPTALSSPGNTASSPDLATNASGGDVAVWIQGAAPNEVVVAAYRPAGGSFGAPQTLSNPAAINGDPEVAIDDDGNTLIVWSGPNYRVWGSFHPAGGAFGPPQALSGTDAFDPQIAFDSSGNVIVVWSRSTGSGERVQSVAKPAGRNFGSTQSLSPTRNHAASPQVAFDASGNAIAAWRETTVGSDAVIEAAVRPPGGRFQTADAVSDGINASSPKIAVDARGNAIVYWFNTAGGGYWQFAYRPAGQSFDAPERISPSGQASLVTADIAFDGQGDATAVWSRGNPGDERLVTSKRPAGGQFGAEREISPGARAQEIQDPQISLDAAGNATVVWAEKQNQLPGDSAPVFNVTSVTATPDGVFGDSEIVSEGQKAKLGLSSGKPGMIWLRPVNGSSLVEYSSRRG